MLVRQDDAGAELAPLGEQARQRVALDPLDLVDDDEEGVALGLLAVRWPRAPRPVRRREVSAISASMSRVIATKREVSSPTAGVARSTSRIPPVSMIPATSRVSRPLPNTSRMTLERTSRSNLHETQERMSAKSLLLLSASSARISRARSGLSPARARARLRRASRSASMAGTRVRVASSPSRTLWAVMICLKIRSKRGPMIPSWRGSKIS